jgi:hypothetical protein
MDQRNPHELSLREQMATPMDVVVLPTELLKPFYYRKSEITLHQGCLLMGIRVIVPAKLRSRIQDLLQTCS